MQVKSFQKSSYRRKEPIDPNTPHIIFELRQKNIRQCFRITRIPSKKIGKKGQFSYERCILFQSISREMSKRFKISSKSFRQSSIPTSLAYEKHPSNK